MIIANKNGICKVLTNLFIKTLPTSNEENISSLIQIQESHQSILLKIVRFNNQLVTNAPSLFYSSLSSHHNE